MTRSFIWFTELVSAGGHLLPGGGAGLGPQTGSGGLGVGLPGLHFPLSILRVTTLVLRHLGFLELMKCFPSLGVSRKRTVFF